MRTLRPLARLLQRSLHTLLLRRALVWLACSAMFLTLGGVLAQPFESARVIRLGLIMAALSALPVFLLWPLSEQFLTQRFRRLDRETVFEAYLEAEPGQVRDLLRQLATERASALAFLQPPSEPVLAGLGRLLAMTVACVVLVEAAAFVFLGHAYVPGLEPAQTAVVGGTRLEEQGFSDFATEDPAARQSRRDRVPDNQAGNSTLGGPPESGEGTSSARSLSRKERDSSPPGAFSPQEAATRQRQGEGPGDGAPGGQGPAEVPQAGHRQDAEPSSGPPTLGTTQGKNPTEARGKPAAASGLTGQGYEHTADTRVPSPLLDYRSRLEARYAERTGRHVSASGHLGFGELRDFQRRYFESFTLRAEVGATDDPYAALLKKRWSEVKGGLW